MISTKLASIGLAAALTAILPAMAAQADAPRTFVSAAGSDSNNCTNVATPCRHLAAAFAATGIDGEIYVLDPANYGSLTITHGVSIEGHGWASIAPPGGGNAITITANPSDKINIIGVVLDGTGLAGTSGIVFNSGGSLNVRDSVIRNFTVHGIDFQPNTSTLSQIFVSNTFVSDNGQIGIAVIGFGSGPRNGVLNHVETQKNGTNGINVGTNGQTVNITVSDSVSAANQSDGIHAFSNSGMAVNVMVRNSTIANNASNGLSASLPAAIFVTRSTITGNGSGWVGSGGAVLSYGDNNIDGNTNVNTEPPNPLTYK